MGIDKVCVRQECLQPADVWTRPMGSEVKEVLESAGFSASQAARSIGLTSKGVIARFVAGYQRNLQFLTLPGPCCAISRDWGLSGSVNFSS